MRKSIPSPTPPEVSLPTVTPPGRTYTLGRCALKGRDPLLVNVPYLDTYLLRPSPFSPATVEIYDRGAVVHFECRDRKAPYRAEQPKRGTIKDMSAKARRRAAFALGNAPHAWEIMVTLTYPSDHILSNPKKDFDRWKRSLRASYDCDCQWAWVMEYTGHGQVHYHIFFGSDFSERNGIPITGHTRCVLRRGRETSLVGGPFGDWIVANWIDATGIDTPAFHKFQRGGIVELFRTPDAAARYVAKEAGKRHQKQLPEGVKGGHRWFWLSPAGKPIKRGERYLAEWPLKECVSHVFDKTTLDGHYMDTRTPGQQDWEEMLDKAVEKPGGWKA